MKNVKSHFNDKQLELLKSIGIELSDDIDYSDDQLIEMKEKIYDKYLDVGFDKDGEATSMAKPWEEIIDLFYDELDI